MMSEVQVFRFLSHLNHATRDYMKLSIDNQIHSALHVIEAHTSTHELCLIERDSSLVAASSSSRIGLGRDVIDGIKGEEQLYQVMAVHKADPVIFYI